MSKRKWHAGPPPSIGWWPASICKDELSIRWWNGSHWSMSTRPSQSALKAARQANRVHVETVPIFWTDRPDNWPKRSRT